MKISRLKLQGFKSFVEATELIIAEGLTGVVGPNGCGKSNLLEALRWVMGETSYKSMRASTMDDVIFSGTTARPARNMAEVTIIVDNSLRTAPSEYNELETIEITRRIEREAGSSYSINGKDVRARDVKILFEDAATGARSPALVRQGQIAEIVNAKPEQRRRVLEDAAGIAGLHSRRHEAELRLKAAQNNLERVGDIIDQLQSQIDSLKRQARQARRYKDLSGDIRRAEAILFYLSWQDAHAQVVEAEEALAHALTQQTHATEAEAQAIVTEAAASEAMQPLRDAEAQAAAGVARLKAEQDNLEREAERAKTRAAELRQRQQQICDDLDRERAQIRTAKDALEDLAKERQKLVDTEAASETDRNGLEAQLNEFSDQAAVAEDALNQILQAAIADREQRNALAERLGEYEKRRGQAAQRLSAVEDDLGVLEGNWSDDGELDNLKQTLAEKETECSDFSAKLAAEREKAEAAKQVCQEKRDACRTAELTASQLQTEVDTLSAILLPNQDQRFQPVLDALVVEPGYELAAAAALGDDVEASLDQDAPLAWHVIEPVGSDPKLPTGVERLAERVAAPDALARRLAQVGVVVSADAQRLAVKLKPGQRLVSKDGDLWRWDGLVSLAEAPTAAAQRLQQKNRLKDLRGAAQEANEAAKTLQSADQMAQAELSVLEAAVKTLQDRLQQAQGGLHDTQRKLSECEQRTQAQHHRHTALTTARDDIKAQLRELDQSRADIAEQMSALKGEGHYEPIIVERRTGLGAVRAALVEAKSSLAALERERLLRSDRLNAMTSERRRLEAALTNGAAQIDRLDERNTQTAIELRECEAVPGRLADDRQRLADMLVASEQERQLASDRLATAENELRACAQALRSVQGELSNAREARAGAEARVEAARDRRGQEARRIQEALGVAPDNCLEAVGVDAEKGLPPLEDIEKRLTKLKGDRERLGGVNLQAEDELDALTEQSDGLRKERDDVEEAVARLKAAIAKLNREGKQRLNEAFASVDKHFQSLFTTLFGGGDAKLEMIESEDPLQGGLEIIAKPPGKKPTTLSLLSGGEQTLTALSLIFAVFLTNPSPICVLDEVDAPLDDANVDRFCTLMDKMATDTDTRFLVITHHPMTMARVNRLFGVTMAEKGVSKLVSVDLQAAEAFAEAS